MNNKKISLLQISDFHLFSSPETELMGMKTNDSFSAVLEQIKAGRGKPDIVIASGDLVHDGSATGYARMIEMLGELSAPVYCMPGNHDEKRLLQEIVSNNTGSNNISAPGYVDLDGWRLILIDTVVSGEKYGHIDEAELLRLDKCLHTAAGKHVMIFLHHQPEPVGSAWLDTMAVDNGNEFFAIVDRYRAVSAISWGHVHQAIHSRGGDVDLYSVPSTCIQFALRSDDFALDEAPPGWRWFTLHSDGRVDTTLERLKTMPHRDKSGIDSQGY